MVGTATADRCVDLLYKQLYQVQEADTNTIKDNTIECLAWIESLEDLLKDDRKFICNRYKRSERMFLWRKCNLSACKSKAKKDPFESNEILHLEKRTALVVFFPKRKTFKIKNSLFLCVVPRF